MAVSEDIVLKVGVETTGAKKGLDKMRNEVKNTAKSVNELGGEGGALSKLTNMNTKTIFSISNLAQTFQLASGPAHQMKFVLGQVFDQFTLMGPAGFVLGAAVAGLGIAFKKFTSDAGGADGEVQKLGAASRLTAKDLELLSKDLSKITDEVENFGKTADQIYQESLTRRETLIKDEIARAQRTAQGSKLQIQSFFKFVDRQVVKSGLKLTNFRKTLRKAMTGTPEEMEKALSTAVKMADAVSLPQGETITKNAELAAKEVRNLIEFQNTFITGQKALNDVEKTRAKFKELEAKKAEKREIEEMERLHKKMVAEHEATTKKGAEGMSQAEREFLADEALRDVAASIEAKARREELAEQKKHDRKMLQQQKKADREAKQQLKKKIAEQKQMHAAAMDFGIGMIQTGGEMLIKGEEHIGQKLGAIFLRRTGEMLISDGQARVLIGVGMNATAPGSGAAAMAAGAAEIAAGIGMGAASAAITQSISTSQSSAGISTGAPMADRAGIASGEAPRGGSAPTMGGTATDGGGPTVINISYGVGGPAPEQTAQAVADALALATRRGMRGRA
tara:strand:+ start:1728 stop:3419 length:1692 start_codon:yes stop_codon:yes gene_type:complete